MRTARECLKPGGRLFLTVPVGPDVIVWNLHRRYGVHRLPLMLAGWDEAGRVGWDERKLEAAADYRCVRCGGYVGGALLECVRACDRLSTRLTCGGAAQEELRTRVCAREKGGGRGRRIVTEVYATAGFGS